MMVLHCIIGQTIGHSRQICRRVSRPLPWRRLWCNVHLQQVMKCTFNEFLILNKIIFSHRTPLRRMHHAIDNAGLLGKKGSQYICTMSFYSSCSFLASLVSSWSSSSPTPSSSLFNLLQHSPERSSAISRDSYSSGPVSSCSIYSIRSAWDWENCHYSRSNTPGLLAVNFLLKIKLIVKIKSKYT